ncbi:MAG: hypothetical protein AABX73_00325 [Nanoarchaeota archaeon]
MIKIGKRDFIFTGLLLFFAISFISGVSAITATLGNSRMVLRLSPNEEVERYLLVRNTNDVSVDIEILATGDLAETTKIKDKSFSLKPGDEKKAYFTIEPKEAGTTETNLNVKFTPPEGNGVGLSATIIVVASGPGNEEEQEEESQMDEPKVNTPGINIKPGQKTTQKDESESSPIKLFFILTTTLSVMLIILLLIYYKIKNKKRGARRLRAK